MLSVRCIGVRLKSDRDDHVTQVMVPDSLFAFADLPLSLNPVRETSTQVLLPRPMRSLAALPSFGANHAARRTASADSHHVVESISPDRFKTLVGRLRSQPRFCLHDHTTVQDLCGTFRPDLQHGALLRPFDKRDLIRRHLGHPGVGQDWHAGANDDPSLRA